MPEELTLDAPLEVDIPVDTAGSTGAEDVDSTNVDADDSSVDTESSEESGQEGTESTEGQEADKQLTPNEMSQKFRNLINETKKTDPRLAAKIKDAWYMASDVQKEFPGGLPEARELKATIQNLGGADGLSKLKVDSEYLGDLDHKYTSGSPEFVNDLATADQDAFMKMVPSAIEKMEELNPEGFSSWFGARSLADISQSGLILDAQVILRTTQDEGARELATRMLEYAKRMQDFASKPIHTPKQKDTASIEPERQAFERERDEFRVNQWRSEASSVAERQLETEFIRHAAGRKISDEQRRIIGTAVVTALNSAENADIKKKIDAYYKAGDKEGYIKLKKTLYDQVIPREMGRAFDAVVGKKPGVKPNTQKPAVAAPQAGVAPAQGIKIVAQKPAPATIDRFRTTQDDILKGIYTLQDGSRVQLRS